VDIFQRSNTIFKDQQKMVASSLRNSS